MNSMSMIVCEGVCVQYPQFTLGPVTCEFNAGIHAVLGPNGAGKSTLLRCITGLQKPDCGAITVVGLRSEGRNQNILDTLGLVADSRDYLPNELTAAEYWKLIARIRSHGNKKRAENIFQSALEYADQLKFYSNKGKLISDLSLGNAKKVQIIGALAHSPRVVILDEPKSGLDPKAGQLFEQLITRLGDEGKCVVIASHDVRWAQDAADYTHIILDGQIVFSESTKNWLSVSGQNLIDVYMELAGESEEK